MATAEDVPRLVAQGRTVTEVLEIARDAAKKLIEARKERKERKKALPLQAIADSFEYPLIVNG